MARKQKMKVYHGIPKSITDEHTIFYTSFDGVIKPVIGETISSASVNFIQMPTGYGVRSAIGGINYRLHGRRSMYSTFSIDFWIDIREFRNITSGYPEILAFRLNDTNALKIYYSGASDRIYCEIYKSDGYNELTILRKVRADISTPDFCHIRLTCTGSILTSYCNGKLQQTLDLMSNSTYREFETIIVHSTRTISDLHVSNIDRGDYFPNLPQDFIEGKATIKPRMGQQQIKGDPMHSQVTTLKIPSEKRIGQFYNPTPESDGLYRSVINPELAVGSNSWSAGSKFKIKGLNGEVISGVIDSDTALFTALSSPEGNKLYVDDVSRIKDGDQFKAWNLSKNTVDGGIYTVASIDVPKKLITLTHNLTAVWTQEAINSGWVKGVEITASTSSPAVKLKDGTVVNGSWSGLGTNEVTFTLGANPGLQGQDLYVEYSLTMLYGNSDFPELPHTVERAWGENGVEMKPTNTLTIVDDFFGKVGGSLKECPHIMDRYFNYGLITLDKITDKSSYQSYYNTLATKNGSTVHTSTNTSTGRGQIVFDINLIEMVERKLGVPIPQVDKVSWLKSNVIQIRFNHYGYGVGSNGNKLYLAKYNTVTKDWNTPGVSTTSSNVTLLRQVINPTYYEIDEKGHIYLLAYTDTSDGNVTVNVRTDYISIEIDLKLDSNYTLMYCENKRAREDKCNPVLIQRETKTVKRYLPSKECFATESLYVSQPQSAGNISGDTSRTKLLEDPYIYICSLGTGFVSPTKEFYRDCLSHVGDSYIKSILCNLDGSVLEVNLNNSLRFTRVPCTTSNGNNKYVLPSKYFEGEYLCIKPFLTMKNNELVITLSLRHMRNGSHLYHTEREYNITNRPLIK